LKNKHILIGIVFMLVCIFLLVGMVDHQAQAKPTTQTWQQVNEDGFGDPFNKLVLSQASFGDYLYAGTWRYDVVTESTQIWRSYNGEDWEKVDVRSVHGTSNMIVYKGSIYAGSMDGYIWSSPDGVTWTEIISDGFGDPDNGIATFAVYNDMLYASTSNWAGTEIWRTNNGTQWDLFVDSGRGNFHNSYTSAAVVFDGKLYFGVFNQFEGAQLWRTNGISVTPIITDGFGTIENWAVSSFAILDDHLYAGLWNSQDVQVWRTINGEDWEPVISGFGNPPYRSRNALEVFHEKLYLVVECDSTGIEVWQTSNGTDWVQVGFNGFGDANNATVYWDNSTTVFKDKLYIGTGNTITGGEVWQMSEYYSLYLPVLRK